MPNVYIANFGRKNYQWPECLERSILTTTNSEAAHAYWEAGNREGFIRHCLEHEKTAFGNAPTKPVASRWFNLMSIVSESAHDIWIHREKDDIWWTTSLPDAPEITLEEDHGPDAAPGTRIFVCRKPCEAWSNNTERGGVLRWPGLHPRARDFLFTEGTLQQLAPDNANYARALLAGDPLSAWENRPEWTRKLAQSHTQPVRYASARDKSIYRMVSTTLKTVQNATGGIVEKASKVKLLRLSEKELETYLAQLLEEQDYTCALSGLPLLMDGIEGNKELLCSLDRIDSSGHYERGNLQIVCRFINRWKGADDDEAFRRLMHLVQSQEAS